MDKTPDEIKKGLECCNGDDEDVRCVGCPYSGGGFDCICMLTADVLAYIQQLEAEREAVAEELKNAHSCFACKKFHRNGGECVGGSVCMMRDFEWRGVQKEVQP